MIFNIFGGLVKSLGVYRHSPLLLAVFLIIQLICIIVSCIFDNMYFKSVISETSFTNKRYNRVKHFVYDTIVNLSNSMFVLMVDEKTNIVSPALYTKKSNKISMINRNAEYTVFEHIDFSESHCPNEYKFIRACKLRDKKTGEQVLFVAVPNRETDILAYSDSLHKADKTVTFGKFRIFCLSNLMATYIRICLSIQKKYLLKKQREKVCILSDLTKLQNKIKVQKVIRFVKHYQKLLLTKYNF